MATTLSSQLIFSDEMVKATELNRHSGQILDRAKVRPITIARNEDFFTLINRDELSTLVQEADQAKQVAALLSSAFSTLKQGKLDSSHAYSWLNAFDSDEIQELIGEVVSQHQLAQSSVHHREELEAIIHEWHESAIAILSTDLAAAWQDEVDEIRLTSPNDASSVGVEA